MPLSNAAKHYADPDFRGRVRAAMITGALTVWAEAATAADHAVRMQYAVQVLLDPDRGMVTFAALVANDPAFQGVGDHRQVGDDVILQLVATRWTPVARAVTTLST